MAYRETLAWVAKLTSKSRVPTPPIWIFHFVFARTNFLETLWLSIHQTWPRSRAPQVRGGLHSAQVVGLYISLGASVVGARLDCSKTVIIYI